MKQRKHWFVDKEKGYLNQEIKFNQMAQMMQNPDMMGNMVKSNIH